MKNDWSRRSRLSGSRACPTAAGRGWSCIRETVELDPEPELRPKLRDEAVKFLVLREVETASRSCRPAALMVWYSGPPVTGWLSFPKTTRSSPSGTWHADSGRNIQSLRRSGQESGRRPSAGRKLGERSRRARPRRARVWTERGRNAAGSGASALSAGAIRDGFRSPRVAQVGQFVAAILPDIQGFGADRSRSRRPGPHRRIHPTAVVRGVVGDPAGKRLVTIEEVMRRPDACGDSRGLANEFQVNLWNPEHLDKPVKLRTDGLVAPGRPAGRQCLRLLPISPDGKTVAVAALRNKFVRLFSAIDGQPFGRTGGP